MPPAGIRDVPDVFHRERNFNVFYRGLLVGIHYICLVIKTNTIMLTTDTQRAYMIPADKRDAYFQMVDSASGPINKISGRYGQAIDASNDPIVIFNLEYIPQHVWGYMSGRLETIGAKDMTEELTF
jgi:hypothetical protein